MNSIEQILTTDAAAPGGHYSQAVGCGDLLFISGQLPVLPDGSHQPEASFRQQVRTSLESMLAIAQAGGCSPEQIVRVTAYIVGGDHWPEFNSVYAEVFGDIRPARTVVPVPELHYGYLVEVDAIAVRQAEA